MLKGSLTPLVTPFRDGNIDDAAFAGLVEDQMAAGSHGVAVAGTTGEPASLSHDERGHLFEIAIQTAGGRVPVIAGTGTNELNSTLALTRAAENMGAAAALVVTPYYVRPGQRGLQQWFETVAAATALPVILYDIPGRTGVALDLDTVTALAQVPNIVGIKVARADLEFVSRVIAACGPDFAVYSGVEALCFPMLALGGAGHVSATANLVPRELAEMADAAFAGNWDRARELHYQLLELNEVVFIDTNPVPVKAALAMMGRITPEVRPPLTSLAPDAAERLAQVLDRYGLTERRDSWVSANVS